MAMPPIPITLALTLIGTGPIDNLPMPLLPNTYARHDLRDRSIRGNPCDAYRRTGGHLCRDDRHGLAQRYSWVRSILH